MGEKELNWRQKLPRWNLALAKSLGGALAVCNVAPLNNDPTPTDNAQAYLDAAIERLLGPMVLPDHKDKMLRHNNISQATLGEAKSYDANMLGAAV